MEFKEGKEKGNWKKVEYVIGKSEGDMLLSSTLKSKKYFMQAESTLFEWLMRDPHKKGKLAMG